jgi:hypothetical protein
MPPIEKLLLKILNRTLMLLLNVMTQIEPTQVIWQHLGDQAFSVAVLVAIAWILWKRQLKLEDRLTQYLDNDREKMYDMIENNAKAMQRMEDVLTNTSKTCRQQLS